LHIDGMVNCSWNSAFWQSLISSVGRWFSPGLPVFSTNKTDRHDIAEILLKVTLNTIKQTNKQGNKQTTSYVGILDQLLTNKYYDVLLFILINKWYEILISVWLFHSSNSWSNEELSYHVKTILTTDNTFISKTDDTLFGLIFRRIYIYINV
jgi:hypothetical protein